MDSNLDSYDSDSSSEDRIYNEISNQEYIISI